MLLAWTLAPSGPGRRFAVIIPAGVWLVLLNPYLESHLVEHVIGPSSWRALWAMPTPLLITLVLVAPLRLKDLPITARGFLVAVLCLSFIVWVPSKHGLSAENDVRLAVPGLKVPSAYASAAVMHEALPAGTRVAAPFDVASWLPTFHDPVFPIVVRSYLRRQSDVLGADEVQSRALVAALLGHPEPASVAGAFRKEIAQRPDLEAVYVPTVAGSESFTSILATAGFRRLHHEDTFELWRRD